MPHAYGDHSQCGNWCEGINNDSYVHKNLPHGKSLVDPNLKTKMVTLIERYVAIAAKIAQCVSNQVNESMNNIIASKNPKLRHYAASESLSFRIKAAISKRISVSSTPTVLWKNWSTHRVGKVCLLRNWKIIFAMQWHFETAIS